MIYVTVDLNLLKEHIKWKINRRDVQQINSFEVACSICETSQHQNLPEAAQGSILQKTYIDMNLQMTQ